MLERLQRVDVYPDMALWAKYMEGAGVGACEKQDKIPLVARHG